MKVVFSIKVGLNAGLSPVILGKLAKSSSPETSPQVRVSF